MAKILDLDMANGRFCARRDAVEGNVLFCSDDKGYMQLTVALYSLLKNAERDRPLCVSIFTGGDNMLSAEHYAALEELVAKYPFAKLRLVDVSSILTKYRVVFYNPNVPWGILTWARCFIGEVFKEEKGNVVYLDIDTLICSDLSELYELDLGTDVLAAVYEESRQEGMGRGAAFWQGPIMDPRAERYFNAGVQVFNLAVFQKEHVLSVIADWYAQHRAEATRCDQDTLNALFWNRIRPLPPTYNYSDGWCERQLKHSCREKWWRGNSPCEVLEAIVAPRIIHFWGFKKPWAWNHRPEGKRYEQAMRDLGFLKRGEALPGTTLSRRLVSLFFSGYHAILRRLARYRLQYGRW